MTDISGTWLGTYWQDQAPTRFEMVLVQGNQSIQGQILDDSSLGEATLSGTITGNLLSFTKQYVGHQGHRVAYEGRVSEDFMQGHWRIGQLQGPWEAHRQSDNLSLTQQINRQVATPVR